MTNPNSELDRALEAAHLPALLMALVHMTGDAGWLRPEWTPVYQPLSPPGDTGLSEEAKADIRTEAKAAIESYVAAGSLKMPSPDTPTLRRMMDFIAGAPIPEMYADFLVDELAISGKSSKDPQFDQPELKAAARKLKVLVIGAGMSGLLTGIRLQQTGVQFEIVEKNPDVGGTWLVNTYPGCRVDNSNHMYSYSFEPNHAWPQHFSPQPELLKYFRGVAAKYDMKKHIRFETSVESLTWDDARAIWRIELLGKDGKTETVEANAVVTAVGQLNKPRMPKIDGVDTFEGPAFHSAQWRHDVDLTGKRVAVIGTGASAYQFVPEIAPKVARLTVFQRTPPWGLPVPHYHEDVPEGMKWLLEHIPYYDKWYRFWLFWMTTEGFLPMVKADEGWNGPTTAVGQANLELREMAAAALAVQVAERPDLLPNVVPTYPVGGKRAVLDNGVWLGALKRPNVELVTGAITAITPKGVVTADGIEHEVCADLWHGLHRFELPVRPEDHRQGRARAARRLGRRCAGLSRHDHAGFPELLHDLRAQHQHRRQRLDHLLLGVFGPLHRRLYPSAGRDRGQGDGSEKGRPRRLQHPGRRGQQGLGLGLQERHQLVQERVRPGQPELALRPDRLLARHA